MKILYWSSVNIIYGILKVLYGFEIKGTENIPEGPCLITPNHSSYLDPPIVGASCPKELNILAKQELFEARLLGWYVRNVNTHPVDRGGEDVKAIKKVISLLKEGKRVLMFPEGGRSFDGKLIPFKLGAAMIALHVDVPIVPVVIKGSHDIWKKGGKLKFKGRLQVHYLPPIYPKQFEGMAKKEAQGAMTKALFESMQAEMNSVSSV